MNIAEQKLIYPYYIDFVCSKCNVRVSERYIINIGCTAFLILNYVEEENIGTYVGIYNLSCEEQQIKNILE